MYNFVAFCTQTLTVFLPVNVHMPKDRITQSHQGYGFVEFLGEEDADYSIKIMNMIKLYGKPVRVNKVGVSSVHLFQDSHWDRKNGRAFSSLGKVRE